MREKTSNDESLRTLLLEEKEKCTGASLYERLVHQNCELLVNEMVAHLQHIKRSASHLKASVEIRDVEPFPEAPFPMVASDAGNNGVDLRAGFIPMYGAVAILTDGWQLVDSPLNIAGSPELWTNENSRRQRESLLGFKLQFQVTTAAVENWSPKLVLFDGTIILHPRLKAATTREFLSDYEEATREAVRMIFSCYQRGIPVVGFVKRTRKHTIAKAAKINGIRDTAGFSFLLKKGQFTAPICDLEAEKLLVKDYRTRAKELNLNENVTRDITTFHIVYIRTGYSTPFRLVIPNYCLKAVPLVCSALCATAHEDGIPFSIAEVDRLTRITTETSNLRILALHAGALELVKESKLTSEDLEVFALQIGEHWILQKPLITS